jgi:PAS domain S-box-containing protein
VDVPIRRRGRLVGFLGLSSLTADRDWPEATVAQLRLLAEIVANALDRKSMETALRESEAKLREVVEHAPIVLWAIDRDGLFTFSDGSGLRSLGLSPGEVVGRSVFDVYEGNEGIVDDAKRVLAGERVMSLSRVGDLAFEVHLAPLFDEDGRPDGAIGVATDVTERRRLETMLRHSQKMQAVGQLAGGVAHDFNNLLQAIRGYAALGRRLVGGKVRGYLDEILRASDRAGNLVRQLLTFSRREALRPEYLSLSEVVTGLGEMLSRLIGEHLELEILTGADLGIVRADRGQVEQIVVNLCVNARDAMVNGGRLRLETDNVRFGSDDLAATPWAMEGEFVRLSVSDTGCGIPPEVRERVFEPFFTTKETGQGTGLGLATVYAITERHGGFVNLESEVGEGTRVEVHLPRVQLPADTSPARGAVEVAGGGTETILVAEDDEQVAELAETILVEAGYRVLLARDGERAVALFDEHAAEIAAAVLDVVMPKMSGREVSEAILARRPELPILFTSGYRGDILEGLPGPEPTILRKPFAPRSLLARVRELISGSPAD